MQLDAFSEFFSGLHDSRQSAKIAYPLFDILFLTVCAVIGGCEGWEDIEDFGQAHSHWFQDKGGSKWIAGSRYNCQGDFQS